MSVCIRLKMHLEQGREAYRCWRKHFSRSPGASLGCATITWLYFSACLSVMARCGSVAAVLGVSVGLFSRPLTCGFNRRIESHQKHFPHPQFQIPGPERWRPWLQLHSRSPTTPSLHLRLRRKDKKSHQEGRETRENPIWER